MPIASVFQFDVDEGHQLVKTILYNQGFALGTEINIDQPPLLPLVLAPWLQFWDNSVLAARLLILGFSTLLVWSFAQILRRSVGDRYAILGTAMLLITANFLRLSVSVMVGMPSLACILFSLYSLIRYQESQRWPWLLCSAIAAGVSLQFKMFTMLLLPLWAVVLWLESQASRQQQPPGYPNRVHIQIPCFAPGENYRFQIGCGLVWQKLCLWSVGILLTFIGISLVCGVFSVETFLGFHIRSDVKSAFVNEHSLRDVALFYLQEFDYVCLSMFFIVAQWRRHFSAWQRKLSGESRSQFDLSFNLNDLPFIWLVWVTIFLVNHKPIWYHHYMLIAIPLTWQAVLGLRTCWTTIQTRQLFRRLRRSGLQALRLPVLVLGFFILALPIKLTVLQLHNRSLLQSSQQHWQVVTQLQKNQMQSDWLFTDIPMYGVYSHINLPPEVVTLSRKQIASKQFDLELFQAIVTTSGGKLM
jgi:hypothetical protein